MSAPSRSKSGAAPIVPLQAFLFGVLLLAAAPALAADTFTYSADSMSAALPQNSQHAVLMGHARVQTSDLRITADRIELFGKDLIYAQCTGSVHVVDTRRGLDLTSDEMFYDRDRKIARIKGNAVMADLENQIVARGGFIEDRDTEQLTIIQIGVRIFKNDIECKAEFARYYRDRKVLELSGMPWVSKAGDVYTGTRITIDLDTEEISAEGGVSGTVQDKTKPQDQGTPPQDQGTPPQDGTPPQGEAPPQSGTQDQEKSAPGASGGSTSGQ